MLSGSVLWDDEEGASGTNKNANSGSLPAGVYNQDTKIFFCCHTAGSYDNPIELPFDKPFYLIAFTSHCQEVLNTVHTMEHIVYDTEDYYNHDDQTYPYPYGADFGEPRIYYCYYQACLWTLTALKGTFSSPYYPQNYNNKASCMWHINVPSNYTISLTFTDFSAERHCCHCDYVEVWENLPNGSAALIKRLCGEANPSKPVRSSGNNMTVKFHSDSTITARGFEASYQAIPVAVVKTTTVYTTTANKSKTTTTILPQTTTPAAPSSDKPTSAATTKAFPNTTTPAAHSSDKPTSAATTKAFPLTTTPAKRTSSFPDTDIITKDSTEAGISTSSTTDNESVHKARNESAAEGNVVVIVSVLASLAVIGGAVAGVALCFCRKWPCQIKRNHTDRGSLPVTFTASEKTVTGLSNISLPDMFQRSEEHDEERYTDINKLEKFNVLYDNGDGLNTSDKDEVKETDCPLYASSADTVKESDNPMYESMDETLKEETYDGIDQPVYERMV